MGARPGERIGIIYGDVQPAEFKFAASDPDIKRLDYVIAHHPAGVALGQVAEVNRRSQLSFEEAVSLGRTSSVVSGDQVSCRVRVVGYRDERGLLQSPRTPFKAGTEVRRATADVVQKVLGLTTSAEEGAYLGFLKGTDIPVVLDVETLVQKHASVLAKTGAGKSYTVGVLIEEMIKKRVALVIIDPHGEYGTLGSPNIESTEIDNLIRFGLKPKSFATSVTEYALEPRLAPGAKKLTLDATGLEATEVLDLLSGKVSSAQQGLLYQAINNLKKTKPGYKLQDVVEELGRSQSNAKWPLMATIENLESTGLFSAQATALSELVKSGHASLLNLKGAQPEVQEIVVARLARAFFDARKRNTVPPMLMVVEEAHNFCPERGIASARSGTELRTIASEGRKFGLGLLIVSQRPAKVDKNVVSQCNTQIIMKVTNPNDLKAITHSVEGLTSESADEIQRLDIGVALVAGGRLSVPILVEIRTRQTRHGGKSVSVIVDEEEEERAALPPAEPGPAAGPTAEEGPQEPEEQFVHVVEAAADEEPPVRRHHELREAAPDQSTIAPWGPQTEFPEPEELPSARAERAARGPLQGTAVLEREAKPLPEPGVHVAPPMEPDDLAVHRVVTRVGYESARSPREAIVKIKDVARGLGLLAPEEFVRAFSRIAQNYCYPSMPECGPCPLLHTCRLGLQRLANGEVREGKWGQRAS